MKKISYTNIIYRQLQAIGMYLTISTTWSYKHTFICLPSLIHPSILTLLYPQ